MVIEKQFVLNGHWVSASRIIRLAWILDDGTDNRTASEAAEILREAGHMVEEKK